jgi:predicted  nucleic acid-binding Zn-ribbon protein
VFGCFFRFEHEQQSVLDHQANISTLQRSLTEAHARIASKEQELNATRTYQEQLGAELERTKMELIDLKQYDFYLI